MDMNEVKEEAKVVETEVVAEVKKVEEVVVTEAEKIEASVLAQKDSFTKQYTQVKTDMANLQKQFEDKKTLALKLEGALESIELLLKSLVK
jgi:hypothetical protein